MFHKFISIKAMFNVTEILYKNQDVTFSPVQWNCFDKVCIREFPLIFLRVWFGSYISNLSSKRHLSDDWFGFFV